MLVGDQSWDDFKAFVLENGSDGVGEGLDEIPEPASSCDEVRFQISKEYTPKYWNGAEGFATVEDVEDNNPRYLMYKLAAGDETRYYALRLRRIGEDWVIEWFGEANDIQIKKDQHAFRDQRQMVYREGVRKNGLRCVSGGSAFPVSPGAKLPAAFLLPYVATS